MPEEEFTQGCFVDDDGIVRDVAAPGRDLTCVVAGGVVDLCGPFVEGDGREVIGSYTFYPSLDSLAAAGSDLVLKGMRSKSKWPRTRRCAPEDKAVRSVPTKPSGR